MTDGRLGWEAYIPFLNIAENGASVARQCIPVVTLFVAANFTVTTGRTVGRHTNTSCANVNEAT